MHALSRQPKHLSRLRGVSIEAVAWNPSLPTASTREILIGATDGNVYEVYIEPSSEFYRRDERYVNTVYKIANSSSAITGLFVDQHLGRPDARQVLITTHNKIFHFAGYIGRGSTSIFADFFQREMPTVHDVTDAKATAPSLLAIQPDSAEEHLEDKPSPRHFAWLSSQGIYHGALGNSTGMDGADHIFGHAKMLPRTLFPASQSVRGGRKLIQDPITSMVMTEWHILVLVEGRIVAVNRLNGEVVYDQEVLEPRQSNLGLVADTKMHTYWLFTRDEIFEIEVDDEDRDIWRILLRGHHFDAALRHARNAAQRDKVATASGDHLASQGSYLEAASVWGKSSKNFEEVCLALLDREEQDALRQYLITQLSTYRTGHAMQRTMIAGWLVEMFMAKLNMLEDELAGAETGVSEEDEDGDATLAPARTAVLGSLEAVRGEFQEFVMRHKVDLDTQLVYDVVGSHGREEELLFFATAISDYNFVLTYWIQRERWDEALSTLKKQTDPEVFYKHSNVLMQNAAAGMVDILLRQIHLDPQKLIPALLAYNKHAAAAGVPIAANQAVRYLHFIIANHPRPSAAIHNTLLSIYASAPSRSETALLAYLCGVPAMPPPYDADFALRLCIQHGRVQSCVHIYCAMGQYLQAVELALAHDDIELAALVADRPEATKVRKQLWLLVAERKIRSSSSSHDHADDDPGDRETIRDAIAFLRRCPLLRIEDLIPFFPDFVVVDDFKDDICAALETYSRHIDSLRADMDASTATAAAVRRDIAALSSRYAVVEPGERCWVCALPLLGRQFFVFPCQHAFHSDCLGRTVLEAAGPARRRRVRDLQAQMGRGDNVPGKVGIGNGIEGEGKVKSKEEMIRELDGLVAEAWYVNFIIPIILPLILTSIC